MRVPGAICTALYLSASLLAQTLNPVPAINQPLSPASATPGSAGFTLTINGTGFAPGAVVNWNGVSRPGTFLSSSQLTAAVTAADVAAAATAAITVSNPSPGGGTSNTVFLPITSPTTSVSLARSELATGSTPFAVAVGDFQGSGKL